MMKRCWYLSLAIVLLFGISTTLEAAQVNFTPVLTISNEYTDNLFLDSDDDDQVDDHITTAGLSLTGEVLGRTAGLALNYSPSYNRFADNDELDYWRHFASLNTWKNFGRNARLALTSSFLETEDPRDDSSDDLVTGATPQDPVIAADGTRRDRTRYMTSVNELRLSNQFGARNSAYVALNYSLFRDIDPPTGIAVDDYDDIRPLLGVEYWFGPRWGVDLNTYFSDRSYEDRDDRKEYFGSARLLRSFSRRLSAFLEYRHTVLDFDEEITDEDYQIYAPSLGVDYQVGETANINVSAGYYFQDFDESDDEEGFILQSSVLKDWVRPTGLVRLTAASGYDVEDTGAQDLGLNIFYQGRLEIIHNFTSRFSGSVYGGYRYDDYPNEEPDRSDQTSNAGAAVNYQVKRWAQFRLAYNYSDVSSDIETEEYTENSIIVTLTFSPSSPFRLN